MKLAHRLADRTQRCISEMTDHIKREAADGERRYKFHEHLLVGNGVDVRQIVEHFEGEGFTVRREVVSAGAPPMGWPNDDATMVEYTISW